LRVVADEGPVEDGDGFEIRPVGFAVTIVGIIATAISLAALSWYSVSGPNVITDPSDPGPAAGGSFVVLVDRDISSHHSWVVWTLFVLCAIAAVIAGLPNRIASQRMRIVAPALAAPLIIGAIARVAVPRLAVDTVGLVESGDLDVSIGFGFWLALLGLVLIAIGAAVGPRHRDVAA
jgi:hypothetical protein